MKILWETGTFALMLLSHLSEYLCKYENLESAAKSLENDAIGQVMNACEMFYDPSKSVLQMLQMLKNACECRCESYECVANETRMQNMGI